MGVAGTAVADDHGFYMGVDAGVASYPNDVRLRLNGTAYERESSKGTDFAWSFAAGYRFNRYLALEAGFADLGHAETKLVTKTDPNTSRGDVKLSARGKTLALLTHIPIGNWDSYFKVGAMQSIFGTEVRAKVDGDEFQRSWQNEDTRVLLGVGTRYAFTEQWAVSFALDYYVKMGGPLTASVASPRIGIAYRF
jgi:long-subunit fatty acid transport protein